MSMATPSAHAHVRPLPPRPAVFRLDGADMGFADWRAGSGLDRRLGAASPARNAGLALGLTWCGTAPDLGAFESDCP
ncbi:hypothetical protein [Myxococcus sp. RHSTA-1-4]|uniref:hypothetical protein n=1 Tax=Myxococcus sp. RHSTA-1-4 TaxID=2874601 RepID=UPI001CBED7BD|nr:hypothetical protein [Myxococcus sp. RHSTA-1-4]MBZ4418016.1 hypothetical protein [Myxococcus sp. RHSTA-1-4]